MDTYVHVGLEYSSDKSHRCIHFDKYNLANDLLHGIQRLFHKHQGMDLRICFECTPDLMDNHYSMYTLADSLRTDCHSSQANIDMSQHHFVHDKQR